MSSNECILVISDLQMPYHHPDAIEFLKEIKKQFKPTRIINIGDEVDFQALNFHTINPDMESASTELENARYYIAQLAEVFPDMDVLLSNHGALPKRRAIANGIPSMFLKSMGEVLETPEGWRWHYLIDATMPNGQQVRFIHNYSSNIIQSSKDIGKSLVTGHFHSKFELHYYQQDGIHKFAAIIGCLIDDTSMAFQYNKTQAKRPVLGSMIILNGVPMLIPMQLNLAGRWVGYL